MSFHISTNVTFSRTEKPQELSSGTAYVTNLRILWISDSNPPSSRYHALALDLAHIRSFDKGGNRLRKITSSPRIRIYFPGGKSREMIATPMPRLDPVLTPSPPTQKWVCEICGHDENTSMNPQVCDICGVERDVESTQISIMVTVEPEEEDDVPNSLHKQCPQCSYLNSPAADVCEMCSTRLLSPQGRPKSPSVTRLALAGPSASDGPQFRQGYPLSSAPTPTNSVNGPLLAQSSKPLPEPPTSFIQLAFRAPPNSGTYLNIQQQTLRDDFLARLSSAVAGRAWEVREKAERARRGAEEKRRREEDERRHASEAALARSAGISHLVARHEQRVSDIQFLLTGAFSGDLEALIGQAKDIVEKARQITHRLTEADSSQGGGQEGETFRSYLAELGVVSIESPVTKETAGTQYHAQLAREVSDTLDHIFRTSPSKPYTSMATGTTRAPPSMLPLTEVYTLITRARANNLVSPDDLAKSCTLMDGMGLPYIMRKFRSGLLCLCERGLNDDQIAARVARVCKEFTDDSLRTSGDRGLHFTGTIRSGPYGVGPTVVQIAQACDVSVLLATDWVDVSEGRGVVVRDESWDGTRYFLNVFPRSLWARQQV
ncbi:Vps36-domain-containing protein [Gonapodya prolifera JEL478]|uniref:Vacuolar protein-sorting-associated protein 36 n=1 Tax=Gonapodya prolifera (strain JEL478) TaxID=1344416 RepID=A0A139ART1_GONPJ|nr:Vps36-domain-containing protein [Gonapodya prolifera JEL478]|eukprot:KXS19185.1 Vps36-domain-containing protein [Gonapodya prolifera JEL478]